MQTGFVMVLTGTFLQALFINYVWCFNNRGAVCKLEKFLPWLNDSVSTARLILLTGFWLLHFQGSAEGFF